MIRAARGAAGAGDAQVTRAKEKGTSTPFVRTVGRALRRAAKATRKTARAYGTPIYVWKNGKVVAKKP